LCVSLKQRIFFFFPVGFACFFGSLAFSLMEQFVKKLAETDGVLRSANAGLRAWENSGGDSNDALKTRRSLGLLAQLLDDLENDLMGLELENKVTEKEFQRRKSQLGVMASERRAIASRLAQDPPARLRDVPVNLSLSEARKLQVVSEREQEALLDDLGSSLKRQQSVGREIGREVEEQQPLINRVASKAGQSEARVQREIRF
jgi:hypothetical protein